MPVYTYRREDGTTFEYRQKFLDEPLKVDPATGQSVVRLVQAPGIIFKGSGFYVNDSKKATNGNLTSSKHADSKESDSGTSKPEPKESKETKSEAKVESAAD
ncbi:MAG: hypothetical protein K8J31_24660 [Anaerolineae bacterium]|nr:hypothetical protein [Anaerolineae bacterium]